LLQVQDLNIAFRTRQGLLPITRHVEFNIGVGERVALVGESGCGKTVTGLSLMRLLPRHSAQVSGRILLRGQDLLTLPEARMRALRGRDIAMIFQEPMSALDPVFTVGEQISEGFRSHFPERAHEARERAIDMLAKVGIPLPERRYHEYPHQLSGGMRQRVAIAIALLHGPDLIIADEPTTALDVTLQAQILSEVQALVRERGTALIWISHDLSVVAGLADQIAVMYAGRIVEHGTVDQVLDHPQHPYTQGLIGSLPSANQRGTRLRQISGMAPSLLDMPAGCAFAPRCPRASATCQQARPEISHPRPEAPDHAVRCHHPGAAPAASLSAEVAA
jgi:oligopeptide/dipeptide ABC transporter ATP-binding protein